MSLAVSPELLSKAKHQSIGNEVLPELMKSSFPHAWPIVQRVIASARANGHEIFSPPTMDDVTRGELLRIYASTPVRTGLEAFYGVTLVFQNCHSPAAFRPDMVGSEVYNDFTSLRRQLLNQSPEKRHC